MEKKEDKNEVLERLNKLEEHIRSLERDVVNLY